MRAEGQQVVHHPREGLALEVDSVHQVTQKFVVLAGHRSDRIMRGEDLGRLLVRHIEHEDRHLGIRRRLSPQVPVDQLQAGRRLVRQHRVSPADLGQDPTQCVLLRLRVLAPVAGMGEQVARGDSAELADAVTDGHGVTR